MKAILGILVSIVAASAQADIIKCSFTEPFINLEYSMAQNSLKIYDAMENKTKTVKNVSFQILGPGNFELWDKNKNKLVKLSLDNQGSDGMSDYDYPYSAQWNGLFGGCSSNFQPAVLNN